MKSEWNRSASMMKANTFRRTGLSTAVHLQSETNVGLLEQGAHAVWKSSSFTNSQYTVRHIYWSGCFPGTFSAMLEEPVRWNETYFERQGAHMLIDESAQRCKQSAQAFSHNENRPNHPDRATIRNLRIISRKPPNKSTQMIVDLRFLTNKNIIQVQFNNLFTTELRVRCHLETETTNIAHVSSLNVDG